MAPAFHPYPGLYGDPVVVDRPRGELLYTKGQKLLLETHDRGWIACHALRDVYENDRFASVEIESNKCSGSVYLFNLRPTEAIK